MKEGALVFAIFGSASAGPATRRGDDRREILHTGIPFTPTRLVWEN
jgi:hypothetical protein